MGDTADFYIVYNNDIQWLGSIFNNGSVFDIDNNILFEINSNGYEMSVYEYINKNKGVENINNKQWPWLWEDSRMTMYTYCFYNIYHKVYTSYMGSRLFDPIKILQGYGMEESYISNFYNIIYPFVKMK